MRVKYKLWNKNFRGNEEDTIKIEKDCKMLVTSWMEITGEVTEQVSSQIYLQRDGTMIRQTWVGEYYPKSGAQIVMQEL